MKRRVNEVKWHKMSKWQPPGDGPYLIFPCYNVSGPSIGISNGAYWRGPHGREDGRWDKLLWAECPLPPGYEEFEMSRSGWESDE